MMQRFRQRIISFSKSPLGAELIIGIIIHSIGVLFDESKLIIAYESIICGLLLFRILMGIHISNAGKNIIQYIFSLLYAFEPIILSPQLWIIRIWIVMRAVTVILILASLHSFNNDTKIILNRLVPTAFTRHTEILRTSPPALANFDTIANVMNRIQGGGNDYLAFVHPRIE
jgi:hypothetical protein